MGSVNDQIGQVYGTTAGRTYRRGAARLNEVRTELMRIQGDRCAVCGIAFHPPAPPCGFSPVVDQDKADGQFRGALHRRCNSWVGKWERTGTFPKRLSEDMQWRIERYCHRPKPLLSRPYPDW